PFVEGGHKVESKPIIEAHAARDEAEAAHGLAELVHDLSVGGVVTLEEHAAEIGLEEFVPVPADALRREMDDEVGLAEHLSLRRRQLIGERLAFDDALDGARAVGEDHVLAAGVEVGAEALRFALAGHVRLQLAGLETEVGGKLVEVREGKAAGKQLFEVVEPEVAIIALGPEQDDGPGAVVVQAALNAEEAGGFTEQL